MLQCELLVLLFIKIMMYETPWLVCIISTIITSRLRQQLSIIAQLVCRRTFILRYTTVLLFNTIIIITFGSIHKNSLIHNCLKSSKIAIKCTLTANYMSYEHQNFSELSGMMLEAFPHQKTTETLFDGLVITVIKVTLKKSYNVLCRANKFTEKVFVQLKLVLH